MILIFQSYQIFTDYKFHLDNDGNVAAYCEYFLKLQNQIFKFNNASPLALELVVE